MNREAKRYISEVLFAGEDADDVNKTLHIVKIAVAAWVGQSLAPEVEALLERLQRAHDEANAVPGARICNRCGSAALVASAEAMNGMFCSNCDQWQARGCEDVARAAGRDVRVRYVD